MAQVTSPSAGSFDARLQAENREVNVAGTGNTVLLTLPVAGVERVSIEVKPVGFALDGFLLEVQMHPSGAWHTLTSSVTSTPAGRVIAASGTLASLADGTAGYVLIDCRGFYGLRVSASGAADDTIVTAFATGY